MRVMIALGLYVQWVTRQLVTGSAGMKAIDEIEIIEARYDAMPPEMTRELLVRSLDPLAARHHALQAEIAFARRMFRASHSVCKSRRRLKREKDPQHHDDCRHWWRRYRSAQASAADIRNLMALRSLEMATFV